MQLGDRLSNGSPYAIGPLSVQSCPICLCLWRWCIVAKRLDGSIKIQDETWHEVGLASGHTVVYVGPAPPPKMSTAAPNFRSVSIVTKRLNGSRCHLVQR